MSHKIMIAGSEHEEKFKKKGYLYNYLVRWLLERVTTACQRRAHPDACSVRIVFSRRGGTNYQSMIEYFHLLRNGSEATPPARRVAWSVIDFDQIAVENHSQWAGLQFSDCITSAFAAAVEPNPYGNYEPTYAYILQDRLIRQDGRALNCGLAVVPSVQASALDRRQQTFFESFM
ncbi:MAG: hypothetical protein JWN93_1061 [Hyphomicrobiales bacterium]|nr:hypothetical protein [Hyphomicrobiales bacterium]